MLPCCCVSVVTYGRDLGTRYRSWLCRRVPFVSLSVWSLVFLAVGAGLGRILPLCCLWHRCCPPWVAHGARLDAAVPLLPCLFLSLHPKGFPTASQKCLIGHRICPVLFCLVVLAWQAGELGCRRLSRGAGVGRCRWDRPGSRRRLARRRRRRGTAGTPRSGTHGRLASSRPALRHTWLALLPRPRVSHLFLFHGRAGWGRPIPHRGRPEARAWLRAADGACLLFLPRKCPSPSGDAAAPERLEALKYQRIKKPKKSSKGSSKSRKQSSECEDPAAPNSIPSVSPWAELGQVPAGSSAGDGSPSPCLDAALTPRPPGGVAARAAHPQAVPPLPPNQVALPSCISHLS